jgi:hypothetical protein
MLSWARCLHGESFIIALAILKWNMAFAERSGGMEIAGSRSLTEA